MQFGKRKMECKNKDRKPGVLKLVERQTGKSYGDRKGGKHRIIDHSLCE